MSPIEQMLHDWRKGVETEGPDPQEHSRDLIHRIWQYKWKWFRPPMWWIFKWAFNITEKVFENCYPVAISMGGTSVAPIEDITFTGKLHISPAIEANAQELRESYKKSGLIKEDEEC